jgi:hypothetical protein
MDDRTFLRMIQQRAARAAISASATRGQGAAGVVASARTFLNGVRLAPFGTSSPRAYAQRLDRVTGRLMDGLPARAASWGLSRKLLNIFLRDCLYTTYLAEAHGLRVAERFFEIPLDSITAARIRAATPDLPRWPGVKYLEPDVSSAYQAAALSFGDQHGVARVHLDAYWWGMRE